MKVSGNLATEERLAWLREKLEDASQVRIADAASQLGVSEMTIRRDLAELESIGAARRVRGGAVAVGPVPFADRHRTRAQAKSKIAAKLLPMVPSTGVIGLDASSTVMRLAAAIGSGRDLSVITNGPETFHAVQDKPGVTGLLTGGELDVRTGSLVGALACRVAGQLMLTRLFMSAAGVDPDLGPSEACLEEAEVKRALAAVSDDVVLAVDSTKLGSRAVARSIEWDEISTLVTELDPGDARLKPYRRLLRVV